MKNLSYSKRLHWIFQLVLPVGLSLAMLYQSKAEQAKRLENPKQLRVKAVTSTPKGTNYATQVTLTNLSTTAIDPAQYSLVIREKNERSVRVYCQNTAGETVELTLKEPQNLATFITTEALQSGIENTLTLILQPGKNTNNIELILSMEDAHSKTVSEPVSVTWYRKRFWTSSKVFVGVVVVAATACAMTLHHLFKPTDQESDKNSEDSFYSARSSMSILSEATDLTGDRYDEENHGIVSFIRPDDIVSRLVAMGNEQDIPKQLQILKELTSMPSAKERLVKINEQIGNDPILDKLLKHWSKVTWGIRCRFVGVGQDKIRNLIKSLDLTTLLSKLFKQYEQHISLETRNKVTAILRLRRDK